MTGLSPTGGRPGSGLKPLADSVGTNRQKGYDLESE